MIRNEILYKRNNYEKNEFHIKRNVSKSMSVNHTWCHCWKYDV